MIEILEVINSPRQNKRFRVMINQDGKVKHYDFGLDTGSTYIDHTDNAKRDAYRKRHYANKKEKELIDNLIPSPALFSAALLWGDSEDITENIVALQKLFNSLN
jgi:hypothetical protein